MNSLFRQLSRDIDLHFAKAPAEAAVFLEINRLPSWCEFSLFLENVLKQIYRAVKINLSIEFKRIVDWEYDIGKYAVSAK